MKKSTKFFLLAIVIFVIVFLLVIFDNTRTIEKSSNKVLELSVPNSTSSFPVAYSLTQNDGKIVFTLYGSNEIITTTTTYYIEDGIITSASFERHYATKWLAKTSNDELENKKVYNNIVTGISSANKTAIGENVESFILNIESAYSHLARI